ncbi:hypothetical protein BJV74DRAFT_261594 [Russula compacta]|nr:hypothetical protein BJV74DRAFT_261594 [Russula compacta]
MERLALYYIHAGSPGLPLPWGGQRSNNSNPILPGHEKRERDWTVSSGSVSPEPEWASSSPLASLPVTGTVTHISAAYIFSACASASSRSRRRFSISARRTIFRTRKRSSVCAISVSLLACQLSSMCQGIALLVSSWGQGSSRFCVDGDTIGLARVLLGFFAVLRAEGRGA